MVPMRPENATLFWPWWLVRVSWLAGERGILMTADLLPQFPADGNQPVSANIKFELPENWTVITGEKRLEKILSQ